MISPTPRSPLFPYTTLFRSEESVSLRWLQIWLSPWHRQVQKWACSIRISMGPVSLPCLVLQRGQTRSEEHTSELQSRGHLVCRLLLEKKKNKKEAEKI